MILVVASSKDTASKNIKEQMLDRYGFNETTEDFQEQTIYIAEFNGKNVKLVTLQKDCVHAQMITKSFRNPELIIFISRHSSASGTPTLSVHSPGNLGNAKVGGIPREVSVSPANAMRDALEVMMLLKREMQLDYEVSYECTHHGPSLRVPTMFAELGSSPEQWKDPEAAEAVAHATMKAVSNFGNFPAKAVIGIGGPHYNSRFTRVALEADLAFGHIIPKYTLRSIDLEIIKQCLERTLEKVGLAVLDWKGIRGRNKPTLVNLLKEVDLPFKKVEDLRMDS
jgi:D-aminoacyl-tRNA deacylase